MVHQYNIECIQICSEVGGGEGGGGRGEGGGGGVRGEGEGGPVHTIKVQVLKHLNPRPSIKVTFRVGLVSTSSSRRLTGARHRRLQQWILKWDIGPANAPCKTSQGYLAWRVLYSETSDKGHSEKEDKPPIKGQAKSIIHLIQNHVQNRTTSIQKTKQLAPKVVSLYKEDYIV